MKLKILLVGFWSVLYAAASPVFSAQEAAVPAAVTATAPADASFRSELADKVGPLVDDQVVMIVHIDLQKLDFDAILEKTFLYIENGLKRSSQATNQGIDARLMTNIRVTIQTQYNHMFREFREIRERMMGEAGINEIYLIVYRDMTSMAPFVMAATLNDKTPEQRKSFARIVRGAFPILFSERGFMVCSAPYQMAQKDEADQALRAKLKGLKPSDTTYLRKAFAQQAGSAATIIGVIPPKTSEYIASLPVSTVLPETFQKLGVFMSERIKWISAGINIDNSAVTIIGQTLNNADATQVLTAITRASENSVDSMIKQAEAAIIADPNRPNLTPEQKTKAAANIRKLQAEFTPVVSNDNQLLLVIDEAKTPQALGLTLRPLVLGFRNSQHTIWGNQCSMNMRTLVQAMKKYAEDKGSYPPAWTTDAEGKPLHSWRVLLLPYLEEEELYSSINLNEPWDSEHNRQFHAKMPTLFRCPSSRSASNATTTYSLIVGPDAYPAGPETIKPEDVTDVPNTTIMIVERKNPICWMKPEEVTEEIALKGVNIDRGIGSDHLRPGANVSFFDATVRFISDNPPLDALKKILTYKGGEDIQLP